MQIGVQFDTARLRQEFKREAERLARVQRRATYELAFRGVEAVRAEMLRVFDRPTPWVLNGMQVVPATNGATVEWKPGGGNRSISAEKILRAQIEGGPRRLKRFERLIGLPANRIAVPGKWAELDAYGNIKAGQLVKIISELRLFGESGYIANRRNRSRGTRRRENYFIIRPGSDHAQLWPGIYRIAHEQGGAPLLVIAFVRAANYRARLAPARVIQQTVEKDARAVWELALRGQLPFRRIGR